MYRFNIGRRLTFEVRGVGSSRDGSPPRAQ